MGWWPFGKKKSPVASKQVTMTQYVTSGVTTWPDRNYDTFAREGYMKAVIAYRCINLIAKSCGMPRWYFCTEGADGKRTEITDPRWTKILKKANPLQSFSDLIYEIVSFYLVAGNAYFHKISGIVSGIVIELHSKTPSFMSINVSENGYPRKYIFDAGNNKEEYDVDPITLQSDILHLKTFHPCNPIYGFSPTEAVAREIDSTNEATSWNMRLLQNDGRPGMVVSVSGTLTDEQHARLVHTLESIFVGSDNAGRPLILEGEGGKSDVKPYSWSPKELDWLETNRELSRRICNGYGVPPQLIGIPGDNTYSNYQEARLAFWEDEVTPLLNKIRHELSVWLFPDSNMYVDVDLTEVPAMITKQKMLWQMLNEATFLTYNEKRDRAGLSPVDGGDSILIPANLIPLEGIEEQQMPDPTQRPGNEEQPMPEGQEPEDGEEETPPAQVEGQDD